MQVNVTIEGSVEALRAMRTKLLAEGFDRYPFAAVDALVKALERATEGRCDHCEQRVSNGFCACSFSPEGAVFPSTSEPEPDTVARYGFKSPAWRVAIYTVDGAHQTHVQKWTKQKYEAAPRWLSVEAFQGADRPTVEQAIVAMDWWESDTEGRGSWSPKNWMLKGS